MIRKEQADQTKEQILTTALRLFSANGFTATSTKRIAAEAGVSEGLLFHHFGTKRGLLDAIAESSHSLAGRLRSLLEHAARTSVRACLTQLGDAFLSFVRSDSGVFAMLITESRTDTELNRTVHAVLAETGRGIEEFLGERQAAGELASTADTAALADLFVSSLVGFVITLDRDAVEQIGSRLPEKERAERYVAALVDAIAGVR